MSDILEKTLSHLPSILGGSASEKDSTSGTSRAFQAFVKNIAQVKTKYEEEQLINRELTLQKQKLSQPNITTAQKRESLVRVIYCHMLGYDVSFAFIHAVKSAQQGTILEKRVGYLACTLLLSDNNEFLVLLINTMQKDLRSTNILEIVMALTAINYLVTTEMVPTLLPMVEEKLGHQKDIVRKKAVICLHSFLRRAPDMVKPKHELFQKALCDRDPSVMWAALHVYQDLVKGNADPYKDLVPNLVAIQRQILNRKLHTDYDFHTVPAPWLSIQLLRLLAQLASGDKRVSQQVYPLLQEVLQRTEPSSKMGLAVIYQCLETIAAVYPHPAMLDHGAKCVGRFLTARSTNLKYLGLKALTSMVRVRPQCSLNHQEVLLDCLEHKDVTIQRKTLELLYQMANQTNVTIICDRLLDFFHKMADPFTQRDIIHKVTDLTEKFCKQRGWYVATMNKVLLVAGDMAPPGVEKRILYLLAQGGLEQSDCSAQELVECYWEVLQRDTLPQTLLLVSAWVLGEYSSGVVEPSPSSVVMALCRWFGRAASVPTQCCIVAALQKLVCYISQPEATLEMLSRSLQDDGDCGLRQSIQQLDCLCRASQKLRISVNPEAHIKPDKMDFTLSFLDGYVSDSLEKGGKPYRPHHLRHPPVRPLKDSGSVFAGLNFAPYESVLPVGSQAGDSSPRSLYAGLGPAAGGSTASDDRASSRDTAFNAGGLRTQGVKQVWGKEGRIEQEEETPQPPPPATRPPTAAEPHGTDTFTQGEGVSPVGTDDKDVNAAEQQEQRKHLASALFGSIQAETEEESLDVRSAPASTCASFGPSRLAAPSPLLTSQSTQHSQISASGSVDYRRIHAESLLNNSRQSSNESHEEKYRLETNAQDIFAEGEAEVSKVTDQGQGQTLCRKSPSSERLGYGLNSEGQSHQQQREGLCDTVSGESLRGGSMYSTDVDVGRLTVITGEAGSLPGEIERRSMYEGFQMDEYVGVDEDCGVHMQSPDGAILEGPPPLPGGSTSEAWTLSVSADATDVVMVTSGSSVSSDSLKANATPASDEDHHQTTDDDASRQPVIGISSFQNTSPSRTDSPSSSGVDAILPQDKRFHVPLGVLQDLDDSISVDSIEEDRPPAEFQVDTPVKHKADASDASNCPTHDHLHHPQHPPSSFSSSPLFPNPEDFLDELGSSDGQTELPYSCANGSVSSDVWRSHHAGTNIDVATNGQSGEKAAVTHVVYDDEQLTMCCRKTLTPDQLQVQFDVAAVNASTPFQEGDLVHLTWEPHFSTLLQIGEESPSLTVPVCTPDAPAQGTTISLSPTVVQWDGPVTMTLTLTDDKDGKAITLPIMLQDFFRPCRLGVEDFARCWTDRCHHAARLALPLDDGVKLGHQVAALTRSLQAHTVQDAGKEVLLAVQWLDDVEAVVLMHCKEQQQQQQQQQQHHHHQQQQQSHQQQHQQQQHELLVTLRASQCDILECVSSVITSSTQ